jgi:hypothetical protein
MWICFNDAFISAVEAEDNPNVLKVRARKKGHLKTLFPGKKIYTTEHTDYRHRVFVTRKAFARMVTDRIHELHYDNFKDSVGDTRLHDLYADFWELHWRYQQESK